MKTIGQMNRGVNKHTKKRTLREREKKNLEREQTYTDTLLTQICRQT